MLLLRQLLCLVKADMVLLNYNSTLLIWACLIYYHAILQNIYTFPFEHMKCQ